MQQAYYQYAACSLKTRDLFLKCLKTGSSLKGVQYVTGVAVSTQLRRIRAIGKSLKPSVTIRFDDEYELDELGTCVGKKNRRKWVVSALSRTTGKIIKVKVGTRTLKNLFVWNTTLRSSQIAKSCNERLGSLPPSAETS